MAIASYCRKYYLVCFLSSTHSSDALWRDFCRFNSNLAGIFNNGFSLVIQITGYKADKVIGLTPRVLKSYRQSQEFYVLCGKG